MAAASLGHAGAQRVQRMSKAGSLVVFALFAAGGLALAAPEEKRRDLEDRVRNSDL